MTSPLRSASRSAACQYVSAARFPAPESAAARSDIALDAQSARASDQDVQRSENVRRSARRLAEQLLREAARQQRRTALLGLPVSRKALEGAIVRGDRIGHTTVPKGGRAGGEFIRAIRVQSGVRWERHG